MTIYNLYVFDRNGSLLFYHEWVRSVGEIITKEKHKRRTLRCKNCILRRKHTSMSKEEEAKLLYGMLFSLKSFSAKLSPVDMKQGFTSYKTNLYRLSLYETPSSLKFVLNTDNEASQQEVRSHKAP